MSIIIVVKRWVMWGINMAYFEVNAGGYNYHIDLERHFTILKGDSGIGKSSMLELVNQYGASIVKTSDNLLFSIMTDINIFVVGVEKVQNTIFAFDDISILRYNKLYDVYRRYIVPNNNWLFVISRETNMELPGGSARLPFSTNSILTLTDDYCTEPYKYSRSTMVDNSVPDLVITEDSKAGFQFYKELFKGYEVVSSYGKSSILSAIQEYSNKGYKNIYVIFDTASFGAYMEQLSAVCSKKSMCNVTYMSDYECFEELLCHTNLVSPYIDWNRLEPNTALSWERYFEKLLRSVTDNKKFLQSHGGNLNPCYRTDCKSMNKCHDCDTFLSGDKLEALLSGTKYERLLRYRR